MLTWGAIFADDPETEVLVEEAEPEFGILDRFDAIAKEGYYGGDLLPVLSPATS